MNIAVIGSGMMGRAVVYHLASSREVRKIVVADYDRQRARAVAREFGGGKAAAAFADVRRTPDLAKLLRGCGCVINCTQYNFNLLVMRAALAAKVHYLDLGGLYHMTRRQRELGAAFRKAQRLALIGMGGAPGITNVMARAAADSLERVEEIGVYNASIDRQRYSGPLGYTFSIATILDELTTPPVVFENGRYREKAILSDPEEGQFPAPIGRVTLRNSLHSELGTLPESFRKKGLRRVFFKINYEPELVSLVRNLTAAGLTGSEPVAVNGFEVSPRSLLLALFGKNAPQEPARDVEMLRVVVSGRRAGRRRKITMEARAQYSLRPSLSAVARDTGFPAAIAAKMLLRGEIPGAGVEPPENAVPAARFFEELENCGIAVRLKESSGVLTRVRLPAARDWHLGEGL